MTDPETSLGQDLMNIPLGELVRSVAMAIADAQFSLDKSSLIMAEFMSGQRVLRDLETGKLIDRNGQPSDNPVLLDSRILFGYSIDENGKRIPQSVSMMELGFVPNFYQFVDTVIEMKVALRVNKANGPGGGTILTSTPVDASYASSYNYSAEMACVFKTKLVPIPPPSALNERLQILLEQEHRQGPTRPTITG